MSARDLRADAEGSLIPVSYLWMLYRAIRARTAACSWVISASSRASFSLSVNDIRILHFGCGFPLRRILLAMLDGVSHRLVTFSGESCCGLVACTESWRRRWVVLSTVSAGAWVPWPLWVQSQLAAASGSVPRSGRGCRVIQVCLGIEEGTGRKRYPSEALKGAQGRSRALRGWLGLAFQAQEGFWGGRRVELERRGGIGAVLRRSLSGAASFD